jgi:hypothetical protein
MQYTDILDKVVLPTEFPGRGSNEVGMFELAVLVARQSVPNWQRGEMKEEVYTLNCNSGIIRSMSRAM